MKEAKQQKNVHYFPGHMAKALRSVSIMVKGVDLVIEIADARAPASTRNPLLSSVIGQKPRLLVLSKADWADMKVTQSWIDFYKKENILAFSSDLKHGKVLDLLNYVSVPLIKNKREKEERLGMKKQPLKMLILGIPNVGKSTFINNLAGRKAAKAANKPGVTRAEQWVKVSSDFILLDTPGILPMNYEDEQKAINLSLLGSIKEEVLPMDELALAMFEALRKEYPSCLKKRYGIEDISLLNPEEVLREIALQRGYLLQGGSPDFSKAGLSLIKDFQKGELGTISLERP